MEEDYKIKEEIRYLENYVYNNPDDEFAENIGDSLKKIRESKSYGELNRLYYIVRKRERKVPMLYMQNEALPKKKITSLTLDKSLVDALEIRNENNMFKVHAS